MSFFLTKSCLCMPWVQKHAAPRQYLLLTPQPAPAPAPDAPLQPLRALLAPAQLRSGLLLLGLTGQPRARRGPQCPTGNVLGFTGGASPPSSLLGLHPPHCVLLNQLGPPLGMLLLRAHGCHLLMLTCPQGAGTAGKSFLKPITPLPPPLSTHQTSCLPLALAKSALRAFLAEGCPWVHK